MGVGGDNTWNQDGRPHPEYMIKPKRYSYSYVLIPYSKDQIKPKELARSL